MTDDPLTARYSNELAKCTHMLTELRLRLKKLRNSKRTKEIAEEIQDLEPKVKWIRKREQFLISELKKLGWR